MGNYSDTLRIKTQAGFSIVELMVGLVIALLGILIMFQVFTSSEGIKRTTTSGGDAQQNGASALFYVERSLKAAGYGLFSSTNAFPFPADSAAPVTINAGAGAGSSDNIILSYRQNWYSGPFAPPQSVGFSTPPALTVETIHVAATGNLPQLISDTAPASAGSYTYTAASAPAAATNVISEGIVLMKAEYGIDTTGTGVVNSWSQTTPANPSTIKAIRVVVVARSAQPEVTFTATRGVLGACTTTTAAPTWSGTAVLNVSGGLGLAAGDDWKCYRYKTFETVVPIRNDM